MPHIKMTSVPRYIVNGCSKQPTSPLAWFYNYDDALYFAQNQSTDLHWLTFAIWDTHTGHSGRSYSNGRD